MFYTRCVTWFVLYSTQDHQKSSLFTSVAAMSLQVQHATYARYGVSTSVWWPMYAAGIDLGQLMHVLYPLGNLICTIFNSTPSEELTFHLSCCYLAQSPLQDTAKICTIRPAHEETSGLTAAIGRSPLVWWLYLLPGGVHHGQRAHVPVHSHDS